MSLGVHRKLLSCLGISALLWLALPAAARAQNGFPCATFGTPCAVGCQTHHCPPAFKYCYEGAPHIHWTRGCPHPICNPCDLPHWGYFETCWTPWPWPTSYAHCPVPPPSSFVTIHAMPNQQMPPVRNAPPGAAPPPTFPGAGGSPDEIQLPPPRTQQPRQ